MTDPNSPAAPSARFALAVVCSADGYIARAPDDPPQAWASAEEQALFFDHVAAADWAIMGRHTHAAADKPTRRRIIFSGSVSGWQRETQLWVDPATVTPQGLADLVAKVHPLRSAIILGGTRVHDWFLHRGAIDRVYLTIEPVVFGRGLPIFSGQADRDPLAVFLAEGFTCTSEQILNAGGTRYLILDR